MDYVISFLLGILFMLILIAATGALKNDGLVTQAIQQCEQNLPRNQHCVAKITAEVVEDE